MDKPTPEEAIDHLHVLQERFANELDKYSHEVVGRILDTIQSLESQVTALTEENKEFLARASFAEKDQQFMTEKFLQQIDKRADLQLQIEQLSASPWIDVNERLPEYREIVIVRGGESLGMNNPLWYDATTIELGEWECDRAEEITHWMPIPPITSTEDES